MKVALLSVSAAACIVAAMTATTSTTARADVEFPWCVISSSGGLGVPICDFATLEQCQVFIQGLTGFCRPNPKATAGTKPAAPVRR